MTIAIHAQTVPGAVPRLSRDRKPIRKALREASKKVARTARASIRRRRGAPSRPGQAPASRTGALRKSIRWKVARSGLSARVFSSEGYAHLLELGTSERRRRNGGSTGRVSPRPFLAPALEAHSGEIVTEVAQAVRESLRWAR